MTNFYDGWLQLADNWKEQSAQARKHIHEEDLQWVKTKQDHRAALLCSRENGFLTSGDITLGEIPPRCNTGKHYHGEEAIYITQGKGCSVIDGVRYNWEEGSCLFIPFGVVHQHFNLGGDPARYFSVMAVALEKFAGVAKFFQYDEAGETHLHALDNIPVADSPIHPDLGRIIMRKEDAPFVPGNKMAEVWSKQTDEYSRSLALEMRTAGAKGHRSQMVRLMRWQDSGFNAKEVEISAIMYDSPGANSGRHAHMEAILYCLEGEGYSMIENERIDWKKGTLLHIPGPQTMHQHFNTGTMVDRFIRVNYTLRSKVFQPIAKKVFPYLYYEFGDEPE
jgi:gentisate 1,2-dioxygenase